MNQKSQKRIIKLELKRSLEQLKKAVIQRREHFEIIKEELDASEGELEMSTYNLNVVRAKEKVLRTIEIGKALEIITEDEYNDYLVIVLDVLNNS